MKSFNTVVIVFVVKDKDEFVVTVYTSAAFVAFLNSLFQQSTSTIHQSKEISINQCC